MSSSLSSSGFKADCIVNVKDVAQAVDKLNSGKDNGDRVLTSDHFKCACTDLYVRVSFLLSGLLIHGSVPAGLARSTLIQIPTGKNVNQTDSGNYRGIALSSIFG